MTSNYNPGLHALGEIFTNDGELLQTSSEFRLMIDVCIAELGLHKVGEVYYDFPGGGFTAVICLTESHLSIHTWPEFGRATLDVFLSNYQRVNDEKARAVFAQCKAFFRAEIRNYHEIKR
jgi:S-adenosylmethionine decarboxylase